MAQRNSLELANKARAEKKHAMQIWVLELVLNGKSVKEIETLTNYSKSRIYDAIKRFDKDFVLDAYTQYFTSKKTVTFNQYQTFIELDCNYKKYRKQYGKKKVIISEWGEEIEVVDKKEPITKQAETTDWYFERKERVKKANLLMQLKEAINYVNLMESKNTFATRMLMQQRKTYNIEGRHLTIEEVRELYNRLINEGN